jgi:putative DNA primase/helicase
MSSSSTTRREKPVKPKVECRPENIPKALRRLEQWGVWKNIPDPKSPKGYKKIPYNPTTHKPARSNNPDDWYEFEVAVAACETGKYAGLAFLLTEADGFCGVDLDHCIENEKFKPEAKKILKLLDSYTEISPSGTGVKCIIKAKKQGDKCGCTGFEIYEKKRFLALTGEVVGGVSQAVEDRQEELDQLYEQYLAKPAKAKAVSAAPERGTSFLDDKGLLRLARAAKNGDKFKALYDKGDLSAYDDNHSQADLALCFHLAFWTNCNPEQMDRLFRESALYREKWEREDYRQRTIEKAIEQCGECYQGPTNSGDALDKELAAYRQTDVGNGMRFLARYGENVRYCVSSKTWYVYNGKYWEKDELGHVLQLARETVIAIEREAATIPVEYDDNCNPVKGPRTELEDWAKLSQSVRAYKAMLSDASCVKGIAIRITDFDTDPYLLNVQNGTLDLRTVELRPHRREDLLTTIAPCGYDPEAECPTWDKFLAQVQPDKEIRAYLQRAVGYSITGDMREEVYFFLYGDGCNGKGTFTKTVALLLGDYYEATRAETIMAKRDTDGVNHQCAVAALQGKRYVVVSEIAESDRINEPLVKSITGRDTIQARHLRCEPFKFNPVCKLWLCGNYKPNIRGVDRGIWRRTRMIPFTVAIPDSEVDRDLGDSLKPELPGILAWAVRGCLRWQRKGLAEPEAIRESTREYRESQDLVRQFLDEHTVTDSKAIVGCSVLYKAFALWLKENGEHFIPKQAAFGRRMTQLGFERTKSNNQVYLGIRLTEIEAEDF